METVVSKRAKKKTSYFDYENRKAEVSISRATAFNKADIKRGFKNHDHFPCWHKYEYMKI